MDFHNRQHDPQLGRFMGIGPMANAVGQQGLSPYHAMACTPSTLTDPLGLYVKGEAHNGGGTPDFAMEMLMRFPTMPNFMERYLNFGERTAMQSMAEQQIAAQEFHQKQHEEAATGTGDVRAMNARFSFSILVANLSGNSSYSSTDVILEKVGGKVNAQFQQGDYDCVYECFSMVMLQFGYDVSYKK
ncbi:hypothetical protein [Edaphocola aurantiacus]|uniref:hypothetical protein n=1 Tax=Edaphocola aurantiacus TaxID=2601682 RepID=UPI001C967B03|nr:hypothetical protein [Edaphocola aurantiacus]